MRVRVIREIANARTVAGRPFARTNIRLMVSRSEDGDLETELMAPTCPNNFPEQALSFHQAMMSCLPVTLGRNLNVEFGIVQTIVDRPNCERWSNSERYVVATCNGMILNIDSPDNGVARATQWSGCVAPTGTFRRLPLVLGPSAVMTLVSCALEVAHDQMKNGPFRMPGLSVFDTGDSPYPPQRDPFAEEGKVVSDRMLVHNGKYLARTNLDVDTVFLLLTRPHKALGYISVSSHFCQRNLMIRCVRSASPPEAALWIESWQVRSSVHRGVVHFEAVCSITDPRRGKLSVDSPLALRCDLWQVLAAVHSACGPCAPALNQDPIGGESYGLAPPLILNLTIGELLGS